MSTSRIIFTSIVQFFCFLTIGLSLGMIMNMIFDGKSTEPLPYLGVIIAQSIVMLLLLYLLDKAERRARAAEQVRTIVEVSARFDELE